MTCLPIFGIEGTNAALTYTRPIAIGDGIYTIEKWTAPNDWTSVNFSENILSDDGTFRIVKDRVPLNGATEMMLRLRVSRPAQ